MTKRQRRIVLSVITVALALATLKLAIPAQPDLPVLEDIGGALQAPSTRDREVSLDDFRGRVVLLNFGFTSCPDVCPTVLARMRALLLDLEALQADVQPLFVTIDPERDRLPGLDRYLSNFHPRFIGLRPEPDELERIAARYRAVYQREDMPSGLDYGFAHSSHIYLIDGRGRVRAMFGAAARIPEMVAAVRSVAS
ncbi:MAG: SCO family protein [Gammaproteobacteria bacterium]|nr:SCO family protein [Gammaproteobacteria bacterium]